jgi:hypothetical protein
MYATGGQNFAANSTFWTNSPAVAGGFTTSHICIDAEANFDSIRLVFGNHSTSAKDIGGASIAPGTTLNDLTNSTASGRSNFVQVTFSGSATASVPAGTAQVPGYLVSDEITCASLPRSAGDAATWSVAGGKLADSYTRPLLHIRVAQPTATTSSNILGITSATSCTDAPFNPAQPTLTGRFISVTNAAASANNLSVGSAAALTGTTYGPFSAIIYMPIVGIIFKYRTNCMSVITFGDSITAGAGLGSGQTGRPWGLIAQQVVSTMTNPFEYGIMALSGQGMAVFKGYYDAMVGAGIKPTIAMMAPWSPNDSTAFPADTVLTTSFVSSCRANGIYPMIWTVLPVGLIAPQQLNGAGETLRLNYNAGIRDGTLFPNVDYCEFDQAAGMSDNVSPVASIPAINSDAIRLHPNSAGDLILRNVLDAKLTSLKPLYF